MCEWPKTTAVAVGERARAGAPGAASPGPASCTMPMRAPPASTTRRSGSRARTSAASTLPCTAATRRPERLEVVEHRRGGEVARVQDQVGRAQALDARVRQPARAARAGACRR